MEHITLNNDVRMPMAGYGTYQTPSSITEKCVAEAISIGYRSIDTAQCYENEKKLVLPAVNLVSPEKNYLLQQSSGAVMAIRIRFVLLIHY